MVTATAGSMVWQGLDTGKRYNMSVLLSDVAGADIYFSQDGAPTTASPTFWVAPERVVLVDYATPAGCTVITGMKFKTNDTPSGQQLLYANHLNTLATRLTPGFGAYGGRKITFTQF